MKGGDEEQNQAVLVAEIAVIEILGGPDDRFLIRNSGKKLRHESASWMMLRAEGCRCRYIEK